MELKSVEMYFSAKEFFLRITNSEPAPNSTGDAKAVLPDPCEIWVIKHNLQVLPTYSKPGTKGKLCRRTQAHEIFLSLGHKVYVTSAQAWKMCSHFSHLDILGHDDSDSPHQTLFGEFCTGIPAYFALWLFFWPAKQVKSNFNGFRTPQLENSVMILVRHNRPTSNIQHPLW